MAKYNTKHKPNKSKSELAHYRSILSMISHNGDDTAGFVNPNLTPSDAQIESEIGDGSKKPVNGKSAFKVTWDFIKEHAVAEIISLIFVVLIAFGRWTINNTINTREAIVRITTSIEYITKDINRIETNGGSVSVYYTELEAIQKELASKDKDIDNIENRLQKLENLMDKEN